MLGLRRVEIRPVALAWCVLPALACGRTGIDLDTASFGSSGGAASSTEAGDTNDDQADHGEQGDGPEGSDGADGPEGSGSSGDDADEADGPDGEGGWDDGADTGGGMLQGGAVVWSISIDDPAIRSLFYGVTHAPDGGLIATGFIKRPNQVLALSMRFTELGGVFWRSEHDLGVESVGMNITPSSMGGVIISALGGGDGHLYELDPNSGGFRWHQSMDRGGERDVFYAAVAEGDFVHAVGQGDENAWVVSLVDPYGSAWTPYDFALDLGVRSEFWGVDVDASGGLYLGGIAGEDSENGHSWLARFDPNTGGFEWDAWGASPKTGIRELVVDSEQRLVAVGFAPGNGDHRVPWVSRWTLDGELLWEATLDEAGESKAVAVVSDPLTNRIFAVGSRNGNGFAAAWDPDGSFRWSTDYDPSAGREDVASSIALAPDDDLYVVGREFTDDVNYRPWVARITRVIN